MDLEFLESFALGDKKKALSALVPGTEDYYYYHCLRHEHERDEQAEIVRDDDAEAGGVAALGRPHDPAHRVPEEEPRPVHPPEAGDPGRRVAEDGDEAPEEHNPAAVPREQVAGEPQSAGSSLRN